MVRSFESRPVPAEVLDAVLDLSSRAPSAGNSQGFSFLVLDGPEETARFWDVTLPEDRRAAFRWQGLLRAPVLVLPLADRQAYLDRYGEPDKAQSALAEASRWPVPYWQIDTAFATMLLLLSAVDAGLGALFFGIFRAEAELLSSLGVPDAVRPIGAVALGWPAPGDAGRSAGRHRRPLDQVVHRGRWGG